MTQAGDPPIAERVVTCPACGGASIYASSNPFRPFCCARCRQLDLGAWASERFKLNVEPSPTPVDDAQ
ncbi:MAG: DNA gyrase inhibitor YacG [Rhodoferax sp.]|nr:DNA gyrase inhibitor YacG [Rhodoferax sp.]